MELWCKSVKFFGSTPKIKIFDPVIRKGIQFFDSVVRKSMIQFFDTVK